MLPRLVLKVACQTEDAAMHGGGAFVNHTTRFEDPLAGGHAGATATEVRAWVVGVGKVLVVELAGTDVVVVVVDLALLPAERFTRNTIPMMIAARIAKPILRRTLRRRFRLFWMTACFCSRAARCLALFSLGTDRHATQR